MVSAWAKKAVNPAALRGASLGYYSVRKRLKSNCPGAGRNLCYTGVLRVNCRGLPRVGSFFGQAISRRVGACTYSQRL
jgi:hypothetical protein